MKNKMLKIGATALAAAGLVLGSSLSASADGISDLSNFSCGPDQEVAISMTSSGGTYISYEYADYLFHGTVYLGQFAGSGSRVVYTGYRTIQYYALNTNGTLTGYGRYCV